jgi:hypothetical protein
MALQVARQLSEPMKNEKRTMKNGDFDPEENITGSPLKEGNELGNCEVAQERGGLLTPSPSADALGTPPSQGESRLLHPVIN